MPLSDRCADAFDLVVRLRGRRCYRDSRVALLRHDPRQVHARVLGFQNQPYDVTLDWNCDKDEDKRVLVSCTCPQYDANRPCKHIWAVMLAVDRSTMGERGEADNRLPVICTRPERMGADAVSATLVDSDSDRKRPAAVRDSQWKGQLALVKRGTRQLLDAQPYLSRPVVGRSRQIWYVLSVGLSLERGHLRIEFFHRDPKGDGGFGKFKVFGVEQQDLSDVASDEDRQLLKLLLANDSTRNTSPHYNYPSYAGYRAGKRAGVSLAPEMRDMLLPRLCACPRFVWVLDSDQLDGEEGQRVDWDDGPAWRFGLKIEADDDRQQWVLSGQLCRDGEAVPLSEPVLLLAQGIVLFPDRIARLDAEQDFAWIAFLRRTGCWHVPYQDRDDLIRELWQMPCLPETEMPENLRLPSVRATPRGRLSVHSESGGQRKQRLRADVTFLYGEQAVEPGNHQAGILDSATQRVIVRDRAGERELIDQLAAAGLCAVNRDRYDSPGDVEFSRKCLPEVVDRLVRAGWLVEAEGRCFRHAGGCHLSVKSDVDWFELDGQFDFDGVSANLPELLAAVRRGDKFIQLGDGSHGMLPEEWLQRYGALADLGRADGDTLRFVSTQAALLDALLAAQDQEVQVDEPFDQLRNKLRSFDGVRAALPPATFTGQLRHYQQEGLGWLHFLREFHFGGCLADDMGLGKTVQVLALLESRRTMKVSERHGRKVSLVVVPRSLVFNWIEEANRFTPDLRVVDYTGQGRDALLGQWDCHDVLITTYGTLRRDILKLKQLRFDYAILDEAQAIKNAHSQAFKACRLLDARHRLAMTGTPVENHLGELWSLFEFLNPGMLGRSSAFRQVHKQASPRRLSPSAAALRETNGNGAARAASVAHDSDPEENGALTVLARALQPFVLRRTKQGVLTELPEKTEQTLYCDMGSRQRKLYAELRDYYRASLTQRVEQNGIQHAKIHVLEALLRLRQAACHPGLLDAKKADQPSAKLDALLEQVDEVMAEGHKALVFSQFTSLLSIVRSHLDRRGIAYEYLDGRTRRRQACVERFQTDPSCPLFLISLKAGGHGLNLTAADYVFILDPWWNPAVEAQAVDRAHRIGQTRRVFAYRLICRDTVEEKIIQLQQSKRDLAEAIVSADNSLLRALTAEDLQLLLS